MALDGLTATNWLGWFTGIWFLSPTRNPSYRFRSWFDLSTLFPTFLTLISILIWTDFALHYVTTVHKHVVRRLLTKSLTSLGIFLQMLLRLVFGWKVKTLCALINRLENYARAPFTGDRSSPVNQTDKVLVGLVFVLQLVTSSMITLAVGNRRGLNLKESWFDWMSNTQYTGFFCIFGAVSNYMMGYGAFAMSLIITKYCLRVLSDFCDQFERVLAAGNGTVFSTITYDKDVLDSGWSGYRNTKTSSQLVKTSLLKQFDIMFEIFGLYDEVMGYVLLGLLATNIVLFLQRLNGMLTWGAVPTVMAFDGISLLSQIVQLTTIILLLGQTSHDIIAGKKALLNKMITEVAPTIHKQDLTDVMEVFNYWEWKMSAAGMFFIGRRLFTGIFYLVLSSTAVVFQIQIPQTFGQK